MNETQLSSCFLLKKYCKRQVVARAYNPSIQGGGRRSRGSRLFLATWRVQGHPRLQRTLSQKCIRHRGIRHGLWRCWAWQKNNQQQHGRCPGQRPCECCQRGFALSRLNSNGKLLHEQCLLCAQCSQQFPGLFHETEGKKYCERGLQMLCAPCCYQCGDFITGQLSEP